MIRSIFSSALLGVLLLSLLILPDPATAGGFAAVVAKAETGTQRQVTGEIDQSALELGTETPAGADHHPTGKSTAGGFAGGVMVGTSGGLGAQFQGTLVDFTRDLPLSARFSLGYHSGNAGDPYAARRVFINNNTNGSPEDSAHQWQFRFDLMFPVKSFGPQQIFLFAGPRLARYKANFNYVGGNENFDVTSNPWGVGLGLETHFAIGERTSFQLQLGVDYYQEADLSGHDTTYTPDGDHVNPREDYDYSSADEAIDQPSVEILAMMGLRFNF